MTSIRKDERGCVVVSPSGRLDSLTSAEFEADVLKLVEKGNLQIVLDLSQVDYISSAGIRAVLSPAKRVKAQSGCLRLVCRPGPVKEVLYLSGLDTVIPLHERLDEALSAAGATV
jgi:anti-anti-sigma factor